MEGFYGVSLINRPNHASPNLAFRISEKKEWKITATKNSGNGREEGGSPDMFPTVILAEVGKKLGWVFKSNLIFWGLTFCSGTIWWKNVSSRNVLENCRRCSDSSRVFPRFGTTNNWDLGNMSGPGQAPNSRPHGTPPKLKLGLCREERLIGRVQIGISTTCMY